MTGGLKKTSVARFHWLHHSGVHCLQQDLIHFERVQIAHTQFGEDAFSSRAGLRVKTISFTFGSSAMATRSISPARFIRKVSFVPSSPGAPSAT